MKTSFLILILLSLVNKVDLQGTYSYCWINCYKLNFNSDSTFILTDINGEWDITRISEGDYKVVCDTFLLLWEKNIRYESKIKLDTTVDKLNTYQFQILTNGELKSENFVSNGSRRQKVYSYFKKE